MWRESMGNGRQFSVEETKAIGDKLGINWEEVDIEEFRMGLGVELEHGTHDLETNVTDDDELLTAKITLAHLREFPDYYTRLKRLEDEAEAHWSQEDGK
jgi:hypothetical protein